MPFLLLKRRSLSKRAAHLHLESLTAAAAAAAGGSAHSEPGDVADFWGQPRARLSAQEERAVNEPLYAGEGQNFCPYPTEAYLWIISYFETFCLARRKWACWAGITLKMCKLCFF